MERDETIYYIGRAKNGDEKAKQQLLESNAPLLKSIIRRFRNKGVEYDDLFQIACIGFLAFFVIQFKYQGITNRGRGTIFQFVTVTSTSERTIQVPFRMPS